MRDMVMRDLIILLLSLIVAIFYVLFILVAMGGTAWLIWRMIHSQDHAITEAAALDAAREE